MRTFLVIWIGQFASLLGSELTNFAVTLWAWEITGKATPLSLILVFTQLPRLLISPVAGFWVDHYSRKHLMLLGDFVAGLSTIALLLLFLTHNLRVWHLFVTGAVNGLFGYIQGLAYAASLTLIVPQRHYARAAALSSIQLSGGYILAPALAGGLYAATGLGGILIIDLATFAIAIVSLALVKIPSSQRTQQTAPSSSWTSLTFGLKYLWHRPSLMALLYFWVVNNFIDSACFAILPAMVLARSNNNSVIWGTLLAFFGIGGIVGGLTISIWGGPKRRIHGILIASAIWKVGIVVLALAQQTTLKIATALGSGFCSPFPESSNQAIWMSKVEPNVQGRVFAMRFLLTQLSSPIGYAIAGPLADRFFEPAMQLPEGKLVHLFGGVFGSGLGAGMALQIATFATGGVFIAIGAYSIRQIRRIEVILPDHNQQTSLEQNR